MEDGGRADVTVKTEIPQQRRQRKPDILTALGKPTWTKRRRSIIGKMIPPVLDPAAATPRAVARYSVKWVATEDIDG